MSSGNGDTIQIVVAFIGLAGTLGAALITRPRQPAPASTSAPAPEPVRTLPPQGANPAGAWWNQPPAGQGNAAPSQAQPTSVVARLKISLSLWFGIAGCLMVWSFALAWICGLVGIFFGIRDIRSPGTRRLMRWGLTLCVLALVLAALNPKNGFINGFTQGYDQSR